MLGRLSLVMSLCVLFTFFCLFIALRSLDFTNRSNLQLSAEEFSAGTISVPTIADWDL